MLCYGEMVEEKIPDNRRWLWPAISRPPHESKVGQWRRRMTGSQRIVFEGIAGQTLKDWGYEAYDRVRSEEHTSELQSLLRISYAVFCLKKNTNITTKYHII